MKKTLGILSKSRDMADFYAGLLSGLFGGTAEIYASSLEDGSIRKLRDCDLYLVSVTSYDLIYHSWAKGFLPPEARTVQASVTFSMKAVETLRAYPEGTKALLVNQTRHMAMESISQLYHLGISNIEFLPCYPGSENPPEVLTVFTPGEADLAPAGAAVVDLGPRSLTANTVCEIALRLGNPVFLESREFAAYTAALAGVEDCVRFETADAGEFRRDSAYGQLVTNPPYGERLLEKREAEALYRSFGKVLEDLPPKWRVIVLSSHTEFERCFGRPADKKRKLYNGMLKCDAFFYGR